MMENIETHSAIEAITTEWDDLARRTGASPFERPGWFSCWLDAFGGQGFEVLALRRDGRLTAVIPTLSNRGVVRSPTNWHTPRFGPVAEDVDARREILGALRRDRPRRIDLAFLDPKVVDDVKEWLWTRRDTERCIMSSPFVSIDQDWESYWQGLSKNLRSNVRRRRKRLSALGEVTVEIVEGDGGLSELLEECFRLEAGGWKGERGTAILSSPRTVKFYDQVAHWAAGVGLLRLCLLRLDGRVVAFNLSLEDDRRHYLLKLGHDVTLNDSSPGTVLTAAMVERAFELGLASYEFLGDRDSYKLHWAPECHRMQRVQIFAPSFRGALDRFVQTRGRAAAIFVLRRN